MKKIILIICGGFLAVAIIAAGTFQYYVKPKYIAPLVVSMEEFLLEDPETLDLLLQEYESTLLEEAVSDQETENIQVADKTSVEDITRNIDEVTTKNEADFVKDSSSQQNSKKTKKESKKEALIAGHSIQELQKEVAPSDLKTGLNIASKIDTGHLMGLAKGGLTAEDKKEVRSHLKSRLTASEYAQLKGLVGKYSYLLK